MHIGSQLTSLDPYRDAIVRVRELIGQLRADGHRIDRFDIGGGLGIVYAQEKPPAIADFLAMVARETAGLGCALTFEPGRRLVGEAGVLVSEVILVKPGAAKTFVIVDAAMNDLIRPTLYEAWHDILPVRERPQAATIRCDIVGPICKSGDYLAQDRDMAPLAAGDLIMIRSAGAYGAVMASTYNTRPLAPEVMVDGTRFAVTRPRPSIDEMLSAERFPPWHGAGKVLSVSERTAMDASQTTTFQAPGLSRKIGLAWLALAWEGLWPRLVPVLSFVALFIAAAHLDLFAGLDPWVHTGILAALALALIGLGWWRLRDFALARAGSGHPPPRARQRRAAPAAGRRAGHLGGRVAPIRWSSALWEAHRRREAERLAGLSNRPAHPGLAVLDTWALRFVPLLALIVAIAVAGGWRSDRMAAAFTPAFPPPPPVVANLWIAPPAYTGKPPIYLDMADKDKLLRVPVGSKLAGFVDDVRGRKPPQLEIDGKGTEFATVGKGKYQVEQVITEGKQITLQARGDEQARWKLHVIPDLAPTIEFARPIGVDKWSTKIEYIAGDDFGVTGVQLQIRLHGSRAGRRHAERRRGARGHPPRPAGRRQHQEGRRHLRARPHQPSVGRPQGHGDAVRHRCAGPEGPQRGRDLPAARAGVQRSDGARADRAAQGADARSQGLPARRRRRHAPDPGQARELPQRRRGPARPAHRRGAAGAERRQGEHHRHPEAPVGSRDAPGERRARPTPSARSSRRARSCATPCSARPATRRSSA